MKGIGVAQRSSSLLHSRRHCGASVECRAVESLQGLRPELIEGIQSSLDNCLTHTALSVGGSPTVGKVRDTYDLGDKILIVTTDRQSAFDRVLAAIPFKGQVLNQTAAWWFEQTRHVVNNALLSVPDPNVTVMKKVDVFPVEFVVRGFMTGSTDTSLWTQYKNGVREYCGNTFPDGMVKNQRLSENVITPTTKAIDHDEPVSSAEIVSRGLMSEEDWQTASTAALELFAYGQQQALQRGLLLVDTKYEMGKDSDGNILLVDEVHTPDSSRYWLADTYEDRHSRGEEPQNIDKEFLRLWFREACDPYRDAKLPEAPAELRIELSKRYIYLYEKITGKEFEMPDLAVSVSDRMEQNLKAAGL